MAIGAQQWRRTPLEIERAEGQTRLVNVLTLLTVKSGQSVDKALKQLQAAVRTHAAETPGGMVQLKSKLAKIGFSKDPVVLRRARAKVSQERMRQIGL